MSAPLTSTTEVNRTFDVFLSYNTKDAYFVEQISRRLKRNGIESFLDRLTLIPGDLWVPHLETAIQQSRTFAYFHSPHGVGEWQRNEIDVALSSGMRIIPVLLPDANANSISEFLNCSQRVDFSAGSKDKVAFQKLVAGIRKGRTANSESNGRDCFEPKCQPDNHFVSTQATPNGRRRFLKSLIFTIPTVVCTAYWYSHWNANDLDEHINEVCEKIRSHLACLRRVWLKPEKEIEEGFRRMRDARACLWEIREVVDRLSLDQLINVGTLAAEYRGCVWSYFPNGFKLMQSNFEWLHKMADVCAVKLEQRGVRGFAAANEIRGIQCYNSKVNEPWSRLDDYALAIRNFPHCQKQFEEAASRFATAAEYAGGSVARIDEAEQYLYLSQMCIAAKHLRDAIEPLRQAEEIVNQEGDLLMMAHFLRVRAEFAFSTGNQTKAVEGYEMARDCYSAHFPDRSADGRPHYFIATCDWRLLQLGVRIESKEFTQATLRQSRIKETDVVNLSAIRSLA